MTPAFWRGFIEGANPLWWTAWVLYWLGALASRALNLSDRARWCAFWYPVYSRLMKASWAVQSRFGFSSPWKDRQ